MEDEAISRNAPLGPANAMRNAAPEYDAKNNRKIFAVITKEGETSYLPRESEATKPEKGKGLFIPVHLVTTMKANVVVHPSRMNRPIRGCVVPGGRLVR